MPDFYADFVYSRVATPVLAADLTVVVEDTSLFPTNTMLAKGDFWLVFESPLTYPPTFEIVKLTNVNTGTNTLTITRGQGGTTASDHGLNAYIKGALTSDMLRRVRTGFSGTSVPATDNTLYAVGDRFLKTDTGVEYVYTASGFVIPPPGARATASATTASLAANATSTSVPIVLSKSYRIFSVATSIPARVELYTTAAAMTADASRLVGSDPDGAAGVMLDFVTVVGGTVYSLSPLVDGSNLESSPSNNISMRVTNLSGSTGAITVTFVFMATE